MDNRLTKLLQFLLDRKDHIVKRNEIMENVWNEVLVSEESLTKGIFDLRKTLKAKEISEIEITTIRNIGYRLNINDNGSIKKSKPIYSLLFKAMIYLLLVASFLIVIIRAIRYTN